jgi:hypothetical protein
MPKILNVPGFAKKNADDIIIIYYGKTSVQEQKVRPFNYATTNKIHQIFGHK